jgi:integrase
MHSQRNPRRVRVANRPGIYYRIGRDGKRRYEITWLALDTETGAKQRRWLCLDGSLEDAQARLETERSSSRKGERKPSAEEAKRTFRELAEAWLASQTHLRPRTREKYEGAIRLHLNPRLGSLRIGDVTADEIASLIAQMHAAGIAGWTIRGVLTPLGRILGHAVRRRLIPSNPLRSLDRDERPRVAARKQRILDSDEIAKVLHACPSGYRPIIATAIFTGIRQGELLGLTWAEVDFEAGLIRVSKQLERKTGKRVEPKTIRAVRDVVLMPALASTLKRHKLSLPPALTRDDGFVFCTRSGKPHDSRNVSRRGLEVALQEAGVGEWVEGEGRKRRRWRSGITFHGLRHTFASLLIAQGADVVHVSSQLGHASPRITLEIYAHLFDAARHAEQTRDRLEAAYGNLLETSGGERRRNRVLAPEGKIVHLQAKRG